MEFGLAQLQLAWNLAGWMSFILDVDGALIKELIDHRAAFPIVAKDVRAQATPENKN